MSQSPAAAKTERLLNLVIALLYTRRPLLKQQIRRAVVAYDQDSDEAFDRMFERDKDELRDLGIPLVTEHVDSLFEDEPGYRIDRREYALPEISFEPDELAALGLAARTWTHAAQARSSAQALRKLAAAGVQGDGEAMLPVQPRVRTTEAAFGAVKDAVVRSYPIRFSYRRSGGRVGERHVQPWGIASWHGRWYLTGFDTDREAPRVFRVGRIEGAVARDGAPGSYTVPPEHDSRSMISRDVGERAARTAVLAVRPGRAQALRRRALAGDDVVGAGALQEWSRLTVEVTDAQRFIDDVCWYGPDVVVLEPADLREGVLARLRAAAHLPEVAS